MDSEKALAKVFCVTRDEYDMIEDFILYYGGMFGYSNIVLIDNMSVHPDVLEVYERYKPTGVTVVYEPNYTGTGQGAAFTKHMREYKDKCEWLIGLDTDEFMLSMEEGKDVLTVLREIPAHVTCCAISAYPLSIVDPTHTDYVNQQFAYPVRSMTTFVDNTKSLVMHPKTFARASAFVCTNNGNHGVSVCYGTHMSVPIQYAHFHNTGRRRMFERTRNVIDGYKIFDLTQDIPIQLHAMLTCGAGFGYHRVLQYRMILTRMYVVELFEKYLKRAPTMDEVNDRAKTFFDQSLTPEQMLEQFVTEAVNEAMDSAFSISQEERDRLVFEDPQLPSDFFHITCIKEAVEKAYST